jgi:hypothetical protein
MGMKDALRQAFKAYGGHSGCRDYLEVGLAASEHTLDRLTTIGGEAQPFPVPQSRRQSMGNAQPLAQRRGRYRNMLNITAR